MDTRRPTVNWELSACFYVLYLVDPFALEREVGHAADAGQCGGRLAGEGAFEERLVLLRVVRQRRGGRRDACVLVHVGGLLQRHHRRHWSLLHVNVSWGDSSMLLKRGPAEERVRTLEVPNRRRHRSRHAAAVLVPPPNPLVSSTLAVSRRSRCCFSFSLNSRSTGSSFTTDPSAIVATGSPLQRPDALPSPSASRAQQKHPLSLSFAAQVGGWFSRSRSPFRFSFPPFCAFCCCFGGAFADGNGAAAAGDPPPPPLPMCLRRHSCASSDVILLTLSPPVDALWTSTRTGQQKQWSNSDRQLITRLRITGPQVQFKYSACNYVINTCSSCGQLEHSLQSPNESRGTQQTEPNSKCQCRSRTHPMPSAKASRAVRHAALSRSELRPQPLAERCSSAPNLTKRRSNLKACARVAQELHMSHRLGSRQQ